MTARDVYFSAQAVQDFFPDSLIRWRERQGKNPVNKSLFAGLIRQITSSFFFNFKEVRLRSGKVLNGGVDEMGRY